MKNHAEYEAMAAQLDEELQITQATGQSACADVTNDASVIPGLDTMTVEVDPHRNAPRPTPACLYGLVGDVARAGSEHTEANPYAIAAAFMSYLGVAVGRGPYIPIGDDCHHARLFGLHVGRSGRGRKGTATAIVKRIHKALRAIDEHLAPLMHDGGLSSREGLALMIHDGYQQGKEEVPAINDKRLWVLESEFANLMHQTARDGNTLSAALRDCWDGGSIKPATKSARIWATHTHVGLTGNVTPTELMELLKKRELSNGFANRFMIYWAEQTTVSPFPKYTPDDVVQALTERVAEVLRFVQADRHVERDWLRVELSVDARVHYAKLYTGELRDNCFGATVNGLLERRAPMLLRMAMLFALTDLTATIELRHLDAALAWVRYWVESVRFIFQTASEEVQTDEIAKVAQRIVEFLAGGRRATRTEITRDCFRGHVKKDVIDMALSDLLTAVPQAIEVQELPPANGRPGVKTKVYRKCAANCAKSANSVSKQAPTDKTAHCEISEQREPFNHSANGQTLEHGIVRTVRTVRNTENEVQAVDSKKISHSSHSSQTDTENSEVF